MRVLRVGPKLGGQVQAEGLTGKGRKVCRREGGETRDQQGRTMEVRAPQSRS